MRHAKEGKVGSGLDDDFRCIVAAQHVACAGKDFEPTEAEAARIRRGQELIKQGATASP